MKIKIENLDMAHSEATIEDAAVAVASRFGVVVEVTNPAGPGGGWPVISVIGTPRQIWEMLTSEGGWACGDAEEDAETAYLYLKDAKPVFG